jgi:hypothetical protein
VSIPSILDHYGVDYKGALRQCLELPLFTLFPYKPGLPDAVSDVYSDLIFAVINAVMLPIVFFFYPETAYRSLEEMDTIFHKTKNVFTVVWTAKNEPRRYGKHGEVLIEYEDTGEAQRRRSSHGSRARKASSITQTGDDEKGVSKHEFKPEYRGDGGGVAQGNV